MNTYIFYLFLIVLFSACNSQNNNISSVEKVTIKEESVSKVKIDKFDDLLNKTISNYIAEIDNKYIDKEWLYYNLYFFNIESDKYFTMWTSTVYPSYISSCIDTSDYTFSLFDFNNRKLVIIDDKIKATRLYSLSEENILLARKESLKDYRGDNYDGLFYFRTYQIKKDNNNIIIIKRDTVIDDFINCEELEIKEMEF
jgi:hypothetical protein